MASAFNPSSALEISASGRHASPLDGVDPRTRVVAVILISFVVAAFGRLLTLGAALGLVGREPASQECGREESSSG